MQINLLQEIVRWKTQYKAHVSVEQKADRYDISRCAFVAYLLFQN